MRNVLLSLTLLPAAWSGLPGPAPASSPRAELVLQTGHSEDVHSVSWSPDGKHLASTSSDKAVIVWDARTGEKVRSLSRRPADVGRLSWSPDSVHLATGSFDGTVIIWNAQTGDMVHSLTGHSNPIHGVSWSQDGRRLASASDDKTVIVWDAQTGEKVRTFTRHLGAVFQVAWSPDSKRLASSAGDGTMIVWNADTGETIHTLKGHSDLITGVAWNQDGTRLATASIDGTAVTWNATTGEKIRTLTGHTNWVEGVTWSPDGTRLATVSFDQTVIIWDAQTGARKRMLTEHLGRGSSVSWSPDGKHLAGAFDKTIIVWDADTGEKRHVLFGRPAVDRSVAWSPDGKRLATCPADNTVAVWDAQTGEKVRCLIGHLALVSNVAWSPDGTRLASASDDKTAIVWDVASGNRIRSLLGHSDFVRCVSWSPDGKRLATGSSDKSVIVWDAHSGDKIHTLAGHSDGVASMAWISDGKRLATETERGTLTVWDAQSGDKIAAREKGWFDSMSLSPDGKRLAFASMSKEVIVSDFQSGEKIRTLTLDSSIFYGVAWSPDGKGLAASAGGNAASGNTVVVWDAQSGDKIRTLRGHSGTVIRNQDWAWSLDGRQLAVLWGKGYISGYMTVWDVQTGEKLPTLAGHSNSVSRVTWSPDGKRLASSARDGTVSIWDARSGELLRQSVSLGSDWITFTPQGYYHGSLAAEGLIRWRLPGAKGEWPRLVATSQVRDDFYRPDLFRFLFSEGNVARALARADAERGSKTSFTEIAQKQPPLVVITTPKHLAKITQASISVETIATSAGDNAVTNLQLVVNEQSEGRIQNVQQPKVGQVSAEWPRVPLRPGENTLRIVAKAGGVIGYSDTIKVTYLTREQIKVRLHLLIIGVSKYKHAAEAGGYSELRHAANDARRIQAAFIQQGKGLYDDIPEPVLLLDQDADLDHIKDALQAFSERMAKDDVGVIFFAGHGDRHNDRLYLAAHDSRKDRLVRTGLSASQLRDVLVGTKGRKYLFLDACHAGGVIQRDDRDSLHEDIIRELRRESAGLVIATACRGNQKANEDATLGGYFTTALVEGLSGLGSPPEGVVRVKYLKLYVEERLKKLTKALKAEQQQEPLFDGPDELMDLPLAKAKS